MRGKHISLPAPVRGLHEYLPVTKPDPLGASWLENFIPTPRGLEVRGGISKAALVSGQIVSLFSFVESTSNFFAATAASIFDISSLNPTTQATTVADDLNSGDWSMQQMGVAGGNYLVGANGADYVHIYDGSNWNPLTDETVYDLAYDALTSDFLVGETVTGGTSGATAEILGVVRTTATEGTLKIGAITGGPYQDDEALTSASGAAVEDGTTSTASSISITGVATTSLDQVWLYRNRMFFIEKDSLKFWFLPSAAVGGAAQDFNLGGVFRRGGTLVFGATWSFDAGDGQDDKCVIVSDQGEVAVYEGTDPASASAWNLVGRYDIPKPVGKHASINAGGDLIIGTQDGIVPLSAAMEKDPAVLSLSAVTKPVERTWAVAVESNANSIKLEKWTEKDLLLVVLPDSTQMLTANLETGAWATQTGWYGDCAGQYLGFAFVGRDDGRVYKIDDTGTDDSSAFTARICYSFNDFGDATIYKTPSMARASFFASEGFNYKLGVSKDYKVDFPPAPDSVTDPSDVLVWDVGDWDVNLWGGAPSDPRLGLVDKYRSVFGPGYALAPTVQITSGGTEKLDVEFLGVDLILQGGGRAV